jgi:GTP-binding protein HflX
MARRRKSKPPAAGPDHDAPRVDDGDDPGLDSDFDPDGDGGFDDRRSGDGQADNADESHRGGFGEFGGASGGLIERTFRERIVLVGVVIAPAHEDDVERSLDELAQLVDTAGADEVARILQRRHSPEPATYIGKGKVEELRALADDLDADTVVFDNDLTPGQQYNLEKLLGRTALDRTAVILDIFAQNAHSQEGKAQVELAQLRYRLPRLRRAGGSLSQQGAGIGTRGPGETQLEVDRRRLVRRIHKLESELRDIGRHRDTQRKTQRRSSLRTAAIVGYTNAGKSTLLNRLTDAGVLVEDRLFATLDATTRRLDLPGGEPVLLTDTVGFVRKLPHQLVEAFKSTLEVVAEADLLVHLVDSSTTEPDEHIEAVRLVLHEIGAGSVPELLVFNKSDLAPDAAGRLASMHAGSVTFSATTGDGIEALLRTIGDRLRALTTVFELHVPFDRGDVMASVHREGEVLVEQADGDGMRLRARLDESAADRLRAWVVPATGTSA